MTPVRQRINIAGVRERYPVSDSTLWRHIRDSGFPKPHYIGKRRYWFADEVDAWITRSTSTDAPPTFAAPPVAR